MAAHGRRRASASATSANIALPEYDPGQNHPFNVLFVSVGCSDSKIVRHLLPQLAKGIPDVSIRAVLDPSFRGQDFIHATSYCLSQQNVARQSGTRDSEDVEKEAAELCDWANLLVLAPIDANNLAKMLHGHTDNLLLEILRSWNVSKKILMVPGMSSLMWENPMTKRQMTKIWKKWNFVHVLKPILWSFVDDEKKVDSWDALEELVDAVRDQVDRMNIGQGLEVSLWHKAAFAPAQGSRKSRNLLPPELWTIIFDFTADWELAQRLHVYTNLPPPADWTTHMSANGARTYTERLELTILRGDMADLKHFIDTDGVPPRLSKLCIKLIMRFAMIDILSYFEKNHRELFWSTFGHTFLPDKASSVFGRTEILEFWRESPSFLTKEYNNEALDGASRAGFVNVLEWWKEHGLPLKFTEAALEQASSQGHLPVLEWWKKQSTAVDESATNVEGSKFRLKPGKSICYATQNGHADIVQWWVDSGIPFPHEDTVAKLASNHGHVEILKLWHKAKGSKMIFDNQVLVGASKSANVEVLEWWRQSGLKVEYKTCDVEEALEDGDEGERGVEVKRWWARNGLNLGVGTSEWMKTKFLNA